MCPQMVITTIKMPMWTRFMAIFQTKETFSFFFHCFWLIFLYLVLFNLGGWNRGCDWVQFIAFYTCAVACCCSLLNLVRRTSPSCHLRILSIMREELGIHLVLGEGIRVLIVVGSKPSTKFRSIRYLVCTFLIVFWYWLECQKNWWEKVRNFLWQNVVWNYHFLCYNFSLRTTF